MMDANRARELARECRSVADALIAALREHQWEEDLDLRSGGWTSPDGRRITGEVIRNAEERHLHWLRDSPIAGNEAKDAMQIWGEVPEFIRSGDCHTVAGMEREIVRLLKTSR